MQEYYYIFLKVLINEGEYVSYIQSNGQFNIPNLPSKHYILDIVCPGYLFSRVFIYLFMHYL